MWPPQTDGFPGPNHVHNVEIGGVFTQRTRQQARGHHDVRGRLYVVSTDCNTDNATQEYCVKYRNHEKSCELVGLHSFIVKDGISASIDVGTPGTDGAEWDCDL